MSGGDESIAKGGPNGLFVVILALSWWGKVATGDSWSEALNDVKAVLHVLLERSAGKRVQEATTGTAGRVPKR